MAFTTFLLVFVIFLWPLERILWPKTGKTYAFSKEITLPARGVLAILIILHHLASKVDGISIFEDCGAAIVSLFFFLSGYGMCVSYIRKKNAYLKNFIFNRYSKLLPLYIIGVLFMTAVMLYTDSHTPGASIGGGIKLILNRLARGHAPLPYSWFIPAILIYYLGFYWSARIARNFKILIFLMFFFSTLFVTVTYLLDYPSYWYISAYAMVTGIFIAAYENRLFGEHPTSLLTLFAISIAISYISAEYSFQFKPLYFLYNIAICLAFYSMVRIVGFPSGKLLDYLGKISLEIYLLHGIAIYFISPLNLPSWMIIASVICSTVIMAAISNTILSHFINRIQLRHNGNN